MKKLLAAILIIALSLPYAAGFLMYKKCSAVIITQNNTEFCNCELAPSPISEKPVSLPSESKPIREKTDLTYIVLQNRNVDITLADIKKLLSFQTAPALYKGFPHSVFHPPLFS